MDTNYTTARPENLPAFISTLKYACFDSFPLKNTPSPLGYAVPGLEVLLEALWISHGWPQRSIPDSSWPSSRTGWWSPLPGAGPARRKHLQEPKFCRPRPQLASHRGPLLAPPSPSSISGSRTRHFRDRGADAALGFLPAAWLSGPGARTTSGTAPRNVGLRGWPRRPVKGATDGAQPTGAPRTGRRGPPGSRARHREPGAQPRSPGRPPALAAQAATELRASPAARLGCPGALSSRPGVGELCGRRGDLPARRPEPRKQEEGEERRREGDAGLAGALDSQKPSQSPVQPPPPPGRQGAQWAVGARRPG